MTSLRNPLLMGAAFVTTLACGLALSLNAPARARSVSRAERAGSDCCAVERHQTPDAPNADMFATGRATIVPVAFRQAGSPSARQDMSAMQGDTLPAHAVWLESLDLNQMEQGYGSARPAHSVDNNPLRLGGMTFAHGVGTHANSTLLVSLKGAAKRFTAVVGVDDEKAQSEATVTFEVYVDGKKVADTGKMKGGDAPKLLTVDLTGAKRMALLVTDAGDGMNSDHADWAGARFDMADGATGKIEAASVPRDPARMIMPTPDPRPAIHGPRITGATPKHPFLFLIPATGDGPLTFSAQNLPKGLTLDSKTGIITGALDGAGSTDVTLTVQGAKGRASRKLTIVGGDHKLNLTPPMGWNSWNCWAGAVDANKVKASTNGMIQSGLAAHGFQYINIDDTWEAKRDANGEIQTNAKFPDMRALSDYVHGKGLKIGIYSSPGPTTCANFEASWQHELQDARTYAKWGMDYLKYDWCSYGGIADKQMFAAHEKQVRPYRVMRAALDQTDRDIAYSLCQYGMDDVWKWGASDEVRSNCWRTTGDINDSWGSLHGIYESQNGHEKFAGPGHWNDPDMLIVGKVGWGNLHETHLSPNEQILHISMWCLLSSPLLIGCDMAQMSPFTVALLSNDEALDINQDTLGKPAGRVLLDGAKEVWARPLKDGTIAAGLCNTGLEATDVTVDWSEIGMKGKQPVRDLWLHKNMGAKADRVTISVPAHGCVLLKIGKPADMDKMPMQTAHR